MLHLSHVVGSGLGDRAGTCIDPKMQVVQGKAICLVSCQRSPEPVFLRWKGTRPARMAVSSTCARGRRRCRSRPRARASTSGPGSHQLGDLETEATGAHPYRDRTCRVSLGLGAPRGAWSDSRGNVRAHWIGRGRVKHPDGPPQVEPFAVPIGRCGVRVNLEASRFQVRVGRRQWRARPARSRWDVGQRATVRPEEASPAVIL